MSFENQVQQWVSLDNQLKIYSEKIKELRDKKNSITENIQQHVKTNKLSQSTIQISDGKLKFVETRVSEPLTFKYLENTLSEIIKNENQVKILMDYIKQKRSYKEIQEIKRL